VATLRMFRLRPADTPTNIRIVARVVQNYPSAEMEQALARIRWWQSWGFDPFEMTYEEEFMNPRLSQSAIFAERYGGGEAAELTREDWARITGDALRAGEPGFMSMPQGLLRSAGEEITFRQEYQNEWPTSGWAMASAEAIQSNGITPETAWPYRINGRIVEAHDPRTNDYLIDGEWVAESDLLNLDDLPDM
jgi:hypothetical protein